MVLYLVMVLRNIYFVSQYSNQTQPGPVGCKVCTKWAWFQFVTTYEQCHGKSKMLLKSI